MIWNTETFFFGLEKQKVWRGFLAKSMSCSRYICGRLNSDKSYNENNYIMNSPKISVVIEHSMLTVLL